MKLILDTVILFVQDVDRLKSFYVDILGLGIIEDPGPEWVLLKAGDCQIGLHKAGDRFLDKSNDASAFRSNTKIVFEVDEDIHKVRERLLNKNVSMKEIKTFAGRDHWFCDGNDPEGNVFQLKQKIEIV